MEKHIYNSKLYNYNKQLELCKEEKELIETNIRIFMKKHSEFKQTHIYKTFKGRIKYLKKRIKEIEEKIEMIVNGGNE